MQKISHVVSIKNIKSGLSKIVKLDKFTPYEARKLFDFYANHNDYLIEVV